MNQALLGVRRAGNLQQVSRAANGL